jgi:hypothetical protein
MADQGTLDRALAEVIQVRLIVPVAMEHPTLVQVEAVADRTVPVAKVAVVL